MTECLTKLPSPPPNLSRQRNGGERGSLVSRDCDAGLVRGEGDRDGPRESSIPRRGLHKSSEVVELKAQG
jgi:hypothetical protein